MPVPGGRAGSYPASLLSAAVELVGWASAHALESPDDQESRAHFPPGPGEFVWHCWLVQQCIPSTAGRGAGVRETATRLRTQRESSARSDCSFSFPSLASFVSLALHLKPQAFFLLTGRPARLRSTCRPPSRQSSPAPPSRPSGFARQWPATSPGPIVPTADDP